jgi:hypothetical protein
MEVTGNQLREALRRAIFRKTIYEKQFSESLYRFEDEKKDTPVAVSENFRQSDEAIATLQDLQQQFNQKVQVSIQGESGRKQITLSLAIKLVGGAGRLEKMWRTAAGGGEKDRYDRYGGTTRQRNKDIIEASAQITSGDAMKEADKAARRASSIREAIAIGNSQSVDFNIPKGLLE